MTTLLEWQQKINAEREHWQRQLNLAQTNLARLDGAEAFLLAQQAEADAELAATVVAPVDDTVDDARTGE
jgi:hypothetical protein